MTTATTVTDVEHRLRWMVRVMALLRRTTRPIGSYPGQILNAGERAAMMVAYESCWPPKSFARILIDRDKLSSGIPVASPLPGTQKSK